MDAGPIFTQDVVQTEKEQEQQEFSRMVEINLDDTDIQNIKRTDNVSGPQGAKNENPSHVSKSQIKCLPLSRLLSKLPHLTKFLCMEVKIVGDLYFNIVLVLSWIIYFFGALLGRSSDDGSNGNWLWALIWCLANVATCYGVFSGVKHSHRIILVPSLFLCVFNIIAGPINVIANFICANIFAGIWLLMLTTLNMYYLLALKTIFDSMPTALPIWLLWLQPVSTDEWVEDEEQGLTLIEEEALGFSRGESHNPKSEHI